MGSNEWNTSKLCLGCLDFGTKLDTKASYRLLDAYMELGGNFLDTANNYSFWFDNSRGGASEALIGEWITKRKNRDNLILATKVGARPKEANTGIENIEGLSKEAIFEAVNESLTRLKTNYIDILYAHIDDKTVNLKTTLKAFDSLIKAGKVRKIGCSNHSAARIRESNEIAIKYNLEKYTCLQNRYSFLAPSPSADFGVQVYTTEEVLNYSKANPAFKILAYSPLLHGFYNKEETIPEKYETPSNNKKLIRLKQVAQEIGATPNQVVLAWMIQGSPAITPVTAASSLSQLQENMQAQEIDLTKEQLSFLDDAE